MPEKRPFSPERGQGPSDNPHAQRSKPVFSLFKTGVGRLKIGQTMSVGYGLAFGIAILGTTVGIWAGWHYQREARERQEGIQVQLQQLNRLQTHLFRTRLQQQKLQDVVQQPTRLQQQVSLFRKQGAAFQQIWDRSAAEGIGADPEGEGLTRFVQTHGKVLEAYFQQMDALFGQLDLANLQPGEGETARNLLLAFNEQAVVLELETVLAELAETIELMFERESAAAVDRIAAERLAAKIVVASLVFAIAIATLLVVSTHRVIARPLQDITAMIERVTRDRDLDLQVSQVPISPPDENDRMAPLARALDRLIQQVKQRLAHQQADIDHLSAIFDNLADGLLVVDPVSQVTRCNPALLRLLSLEGRDLQGKTCQEALGAKLATAIERSRAQLAEVLTVELALPEDRVGQASITTMVRQIAAAPDAASDAASDKLNPEPDCLGSVVLIRDVTAAKEVDRMKTDFTATVSHELRTPLTSVLGFAYTTKEQLETKIDPVIPETEVRARKAVKRMDKNIGIIIAEAERLTVLINNVLDISKMEAGKQDWKRQTVDIDKMIWQALAATNSLIKAKRLAKIKDIDPGLPRVVCDRNRVIQVLINLISNAVKFTDSGSITCRARLRDTDICISVIDTGTGIASQDQESVFDRFKQGGEVLTDKPKGTGLGLPICKHIVEHHGGNIWLDSEPGQGSCFSFTLPINL